MNSVVTSTLTNTFNHDLRSGDYGESWTREFLKWKGIDVFKCDTPAFRSLDVDFTTDYTLSTSNDPEEILNARYPLIEVKTDKSKSQNQCIEIVSNFNNDSPGWALITAATDIFSIFPNLNRCFVYDGQALKAYAESIKDDNSIKTLITNTYGKGGKLLYKSAVKLVNRKTLKELGILVREFKLDDYELLFKQARNGKIN